MTRADRPAPPALAAFLRGVERRGAVFAELQAGDIHAGDAALAAAMQAFRVEAEGHPVAAWPTRFWAGLVAQPGFRQRTPVALPLDAGDRLDTLGSGPRAALLLRLAAGLDEAQAAQVLGIAEPTYRLALQRALPRDAEGRADPAAWARLREHVHRRIKTLPPARLERLAGVREAVVHGFDAAPIGPAATAAAAPRRDRRRPAAIAVVAGCLLALGATWVLETREGARADRDRRVSVRPLGPAEPPASRYGDAARVLGHRDYPLVADTAGRAQARDLAFHSWLAARHAPDAAGGDPFAVPAVAPAPVLPEMPTLVPAETDAVP